MVSFGHWSWKETLELLEIGSIPQAAIPTEFFLE